MLTFMDRYPELRECIKRSELTEHTICAWRKTTFQLCHEARVSVYAAETDLDMVARAFGIQDFEQHLFRYLVSVFAIFKYLLLTQCDPRFSRRLLEGQTCPERTCADTISQLLGAMTPAANQATLDITSIIANAVHYGISYAPIPKDVTLDQATYACATFLRDFNALRTLMYSLDDSTALAWKRTTHTIEPRSFVQRFMSGDTLKETDAHTYEAVLLARLSPLHDITHPETMTLLLTDGAPKRLLQHLLAQLYPYQPAQIAQVRTWAAKWQDGALLTP